MWSIAASRSFARGLVSIMYQMVHVPNGTRDLGPRGDVRGRRRGVRVVAGRRELAGVVAAGLVRAGPPGGGGARVARRDPAVPDLPRAVVRNDLQARNGPPARLG